MYNLDYLNDAPKFASQKEQKAFINTNYIERAIIFLDFKSVQEFSAHLLRAFLNLLGVT